MQPTYFNVFLLSNIAMLENFNYISTLLQRLVAAGEVCLGSMEHARLESLYNWLHFLKFDAFWCLENDLVCLPFSFM